MFMNVFESWIQVAPKKFLEDRKSLNFASVNDRIVQLGPRFKSKSKVWTKAEL